MSDWKTRSVSPTNLHLDTKNPRLGREHSSKAPREIIQYLFKHDKALEVAESIAARGYFPNEPLLAVKEGERMVVVEGNRRLAALKALHEPGLLEGNLERKVERLSRHINSTLIAKVPVIVAPSRKATDRQIAGRHIGTPVLAWRAENRASFILDKLAEGYDNDTLRDELGFSLADIQGARETRAIADMARSLDLPEEIKAKLNTPTAKVFTTLKRIFDSSIGRDFFHIKTDSEHGFRGETTKKEFERGFSKLVEDVVLGKQSSRSLNTNADIQSYFNQWEPKDKPQKKRGSFVPSDIIKGPSVASKPALPKKKSSTKKNKPESKTVLPKDLKIRHGNDRLSDIRRELTKLKREDFPNAGAVLLRVFFELSVRDFLKRTGRFEEILKELKEKNKLPNNGPKLSQLLPSINEQVDNHLSSPAAKTVKKALRYDQSAPFSIPDLHAFVHTEDLPGARDIHQFWIRTEPLFRLMLEQDLEDDSQ